MTSLNRPGGNATGVNIFISEMEGKRLGLLRELIPSTESIGVLLNPAYSVFGAQLKEVEEAAQSLGQPVRVVTAWHKHNRSLSTGRHLHGSHPEG